MLPWGLRRQAGTRSDPPREAGKQPRPALGHGEQRGLGVLKTQGSTSWPRAVGNDCLAKLGSFPSCLHLAEKWKNPNSGVFLALSSLGRAMPFQCILPNLGSPGTCFSSGAAWRRALHVFAQTPSPDASSYTNAVTAGTSVDGRRFDGLTWAKWGFIFGLDDSKQCHAAMQMHRTGSDL